MIYKGVVGRLDKELYLFMLDPESDNIMDGFVISEHVCYKDLKENQLMSVNVIFKDGTMELDDVDLYEFVHGDSYGRHDIFLNIKDILLFTFDIDLEDEIKKGNFNEIAHDCINYDTTVFTAFKN